MKSASRNVARELPLFNDPLKIYTQARLTNCCFICEVRTVRFAVLTLLLGVCVVASPAFCKHVARGQTNDPVATASPIDPFASRIKGNIYQNDFFGFTYAFPADWEIIRDQESAAKVGTDETRGTLIIGTPGDPPDITALSISFEQVPDVVGVKARQYLSDQRSRPPQSRLKPIGNVVDYPWGGQSFVRQAYSGKIGGGQMWQVDSVIFLKGYALQIRLMTNTKKRFEDFLANPKSLSF